MKTAAIKGFAQRMIATAAIALLASGCAPKPPSIPLVAPTSGTWLPLFDGKTLNGWTVKIAGLPAGDNYRGTFRVEDGLLKVSYRQYDKFENRFGSLFYDTPYSHYWLRAEYRFTDGQATGAPSWAYQNSGIQLHSQSPQSMALAQRFPVSVEFDIVGARRWGHHPTGDVCQNGTRVTIAGHPLNGQCSTLSTVSVDGGQWVTVLAEVEGASRVRQAVNGVLVVDYGDLKLNAADPDAQRLIAAGAKPALSSGYLSIQANSHPIEFRRIDLLPITD